MRILLYCIFTNDYNKLLPNWLTYTANNFYTDNTDILIITDDLRTQRGFRDPDQFQLAICCGKMSWIFQDMQLLSALSATSVAF